MKRVLVIAAHPDDELLGCGGTVARHVAQGDEVRSLIVCEGESLRYQGQQVYQHEATLAAAQKLGVSRVYRLDLEDQKLDTYSLVDVISPIEKIVDEYSPQIVYVQFGGDLNRDHRIVFEAASVALRPTAPSVESIYAFYTGGSTELAHPNTFVPDTWVEISAYLEQKIEAFLCYTSEVRAYPHPRSAQALRNIAAFMGNQCCLMAAEAFATIRRIEREIICT
jgi:LmbE family N-acetylglucosaminyl deacetylase